MTTQAAHVAARIKELARQLSASTPRASRPGPAGISPEQHNYLRILRSQKPTEYKRAQRALGINKPILARLTRREAWQLINALVEPADAQKTHAKDSEEAQSVV
jgi:hypothetical protein